MLVAFSTSGVQRCGKRRRCGVAGSGMRLVRKEAQTTPTWLYSTALDAVAQESHGLTTSAALRRVIPPVAREGVVAGR